MSRKLISLSCVATLMSGTAMADVPNVVVDIAPVHSLVARVMGDLGEAKIVVQPGASPHGYSMRPSEAAALQAVGLYAEHTGAAFLPYAPRAIELCKQATGALTPPQHAPPHVVCEMFECCPLAVHTSASEFTRVIPCVMVQHAPGSKV